MKSAHGKNLIKLLEQNARRHDRWRAFSDFLEMAALSISNAVDSHHFKEREARYMEIVRQYEQDEALRFPKMLGELIMALEMEPGDVLGSVFMEMELGSKWHGQFFTPYHLCRMMARMHVDGHMCEIIEREGYIRVNEPACGGAAMIIALAEEMQAAGINYQQHMHAVCQDLDLKAVHMAYLQLSLLHVPAIIVHGNTLTAEERSHWYTPAHILGGWSMRLATRSTRDHAIQLEATPPKTFARPPAIEPITAGAQFSLFEPETA